MTVTALSSRELDDDTSRAVEAARNGPVFIIDRGHPSLVLLTMEEYQRLVGEQLTLIEALAQSDAADFDFDPSPAKDLYRSADPD